MKFLDEPLLLTHPEIAAEWSDRNAPFTAKDVTAGCHDKVWWKGKKCGHEWQEVINNRTRGNTGCPYCSSHRLLKGFNDLATIHPELVSEWSERNGDLKPDQVAPFARRKVWWKCKNGHEWYVSVATRSHGNGCRICSNKLVLKGFNDLATKRPDLTKEWSDRNLPVTPDSIIWKKAAKYWWKCSNCGNEYRQWLVHRVADGTGCPYCKGYKILEGFNDLKTTDPEIAKDWDYEANGSLKPEDLFRTSLRFVIWKCKAGHSYGMKLEDRTIHGKKCPVCDMRFKAAFTEMLIMNIAKREGVRYEIDSHTAELYLPDLKTAFEAEAVSIPRKALQKEKKKSLAKDGITLYILPRADDLKKGEQKARYIFRKLGIPASVRKEDIIKIKKDFYGEDYAEEKYDGGGIFRDVPGCIRNRSQVPFTPLTVNHPELCDQWSEKNFPFKPEDEDEKSSDKVWWTCPKCMCEWKSLVRNRTELRHACPVCAGKIIIKGINDFATVNPEAASEWSPKNKLKPDEVTRANRTVVLWQCKKGHEWNSAVSTRTYGGKCPICAKEPVIKGVNDLKTTNPELLELWSDKNGDLRPEDIRLSYRKQVWWKCKVCGYEFLAQPHSVADRKTPGCKRCVSSVGKRWKNLMQEDELIKEEYR